MWSRTLALSLALSVTCSAPVFAGIVCHRDGPVRTNSPDHVPASPCHVDAGDISALASRLGNADRYSICFDYNETGPPTINAGDLSFFAHVLGAACP
jgi:hypothetical protein